MKINIDYDKPKPRYPYIGVSSSKCIVLFTKHQLGTCLEPGDTPNKIGEYCNSWAENSFVELNGSITLKND
jgi:hypothetical protein